MFVRVKKISGTTKAKVQLVQNFRRGGKVVQKVIRHIGTAHNEVELNKLKELAEIVKQQEIERRTPRLFSVDELEKLKIKDDQPINVNLRQLKEEKRLITGIHKIYGKLYDQVGFDKVLSRLRISKKIIKDLVLARIALPKSKRATVEFLSRDFGINYGLEQVYRALDRLTEERILEIQKQTYSYTRSLFNTEISLIFYDCTTLYFESIERDELREFGYSKDHKFNQSQVLLALAVTREGLPVGYEVFAGNFYEGHTLKMMIDRFREKFKIERMILVADSGMLSKKNIEYLIKNKIEFIVGARLKSLSPKWQEEILSSRNFIRIKTKDDRLRVYDFNYNDDLRLIVSYSERRATKDSKDRQAAIDKLKKRLDKSKNVKSLISNFGYQKFIKIDAQSQATIDQQKVADEAQWDGLHGIFTNVKDLSALELLEQYHGLWQVEESFRLHKHDLLVRPIFHWTPKRIKAHIAIVYMAFSLVRFMQYKLSIAGLKLSPERVREELNHVQESLLVDTQTGARYIIPSKPTENIRKIYEIFGEKYNTTPCKLKY